MRHFWRHGASGNTFPVAVDISKKQMPMGAPESSKKKKEPGTIGL